MEHVIHTEETAPEASKPHLAAVRQKYGFVPNLAGSMSSAPPVLTAYLALEEAFRESPLSPVEQEVVALTVSRKNGCEYCMSGHSMLAGMVGLGADDLNALRAGSPLLTPRLESLRKFTEALLEATGSLDEGTVSDLYEAGYTREQAMAVPLGIAFKTLSNLSHHIHPVPVDDAFADHLWTPNAGARVLVTGWLNPDGQEALAEYQAAAGPIMAANGARPVLKAKPDQAWIGEAPDVVVMMDFPSTDAVTAAFGDPAYTQLVPIRDQAFSRLDVVKVG